MATKLFCAIVGARSVFSVDIDISETVDDLKKKIKTKQGYSFPASELRLYLARERDTWLNSRGESVKALKRGEIPDRIKSLMQEQLLLDEAWDLSDEAYFGKNFERAKGDIHVLVKLPEVPDDVAGDRPSPSPIFILPESRASAAGDHHVLARISQSQQKIPRSVVPVADSKAIPRNTVLHDPSKYAEECISRTEWSVDVVHEIPSISQFMHSLGGCTNNGKIFWRIEDKQIVSLLVDGWFRESTPDNINERANKKSILMGSPGIGKSTLLCVMAFFSRVQA